MSVVIIGAGGQLGGELLHLFPEAKSFSHQELDITDFDSVDQTLASINSEWVINCAAYTQVDVAETDELKAYQVNVLGPRNLAAACVKYGKRFIHISTDFVFGQQDRQQPYQETDRPEPLSIYGTTKLAGEYLVRQRMPDAIVMRTCGIYGHRGTGNFVTTMLKLAHSGKPLRIVADQICSPTSAQDVANAISALMQNNATGLVHFTNSGSLSWYEFARMIFDLSGLDVDIAPISSEDYAAKASRPTYSVLGCSRYEALTGQSIRPIQTALQDFLEQQKSTQV